MRDLADVRAWAEEAMLPPAGDGLCASCQRCGASVLVRDGDEPTAHCNGCAHDLLDALAADVLALADEVERLRALERAFGNLMARTDGDGGHAQEGRTVEENLARGDAAVVELQAATHEARAEIDLAWDALRVPVRGFGVALPEVVAKLRTERDEARGEVERLGRERDEFAAGLRQAGTRLDRAHGPPLPVSEALRAAAEACEAADAHYSGRKLRTLADAWAGGPHQIDEALERLVQNAAGWTRLGVAAARAACLDALIAVAAEARGRGVA